MKDEVIFALTYSSTYAQMQSGSGKHALVVMGKVNTPVGGDDIGTD
jgi:hypothetical protein